MDHEQFLRNFYYGVENPTSFSSKSALWRKIKQDGLDKEITADELQKWLEEQYTYSLHKAYRKPAVYRKVITSCVDYQWQADLVEMREFSDSNSGYNYLLCVIDCFSKFAWVEPLKRKTAQETCEALKKIFETGRLPTKVQFDEGSEFHNSVVKQLLADKGINYFSTHAGQKASIVERFNRSIKSKLWKYFTANETREWVDIIQSFVNGYNNSFHSAVKMSPTQASQSENFLTVWQNLYHPQLIVKHGLAKFKLGQTVRISKYKTVFEKGYLPNFTEEVFKIKQVHYGTPIVYSLEDLKGEKIKGIFYAEELSPYSVSDETTYKIDKILGKKTVKGKKLLLVSYKGWPSKFDEWLPAENVTGKWMKNIN